MKGLHTVADQAGQDVSQILCKIQKEQFRINQNWLRLHYNATIALACLTVIVECGVGIAFSLSNMMDITMERYLLKYVFAPASVYLFFLLLNAYFMRSPRFSYETKKYVISLSLIAICFTIYTVHSIFTATIFIFAIGIMITTLYASYLLTSITAVLSMLSILVSDLFIVWDESTAHPLSSGLFLSNYIISIIIIAAFSFVCMLIIHFEKKKNNTSILVEAEREQLRRRLRLDEMTGIYNRKAMHSALTEMQEAPCEHSYILAIADIDHFKEINDNWGHSVGDLFLIAFSQALKDCADCYTPYRYGGDEFCLFFVDLDMETAVAACRRIQDRLSTIQPENAPALSLTASFGLAALSPDMDAARLFTLADHALYNAKKTRNTVQVFSSKAVY